MKQNQHSHGRLGQDHDPTQGKLRNTETERCPSLTRAVGVMCVGLANQLSYGDEVGDELDGLVVEGVGPPFVTFSVVVVEVAGERVGAGPDESVVEEDGAAELETVSGTTTLVVDVVAVAGVPVGGVQPTGGTPEPVWPGMRMVPAHPKSENVASRVTVPPSPNTSVDRTCRMKPEPSIETTTSFDV